MSTWVTTARSATTFRAADGDLVTVAAPGYDLSRPVDSTIRIGPVNPDGKKPDRSYQRELHIAVRGNYDYVINEVLGTRVDQVVSAQGGEFLIAISRRPDTQGVALWRGRWHEAATFLLPAQRGPGSAPLGIFEGLRFRDTEEGLLVAPPSGAGLVVDVLDVGMSVPGVGGIELMRADRALRVIPTWSGASVRAGEAWQADVTQPGDSHRHRNLLLASGSAVLTVIPDDPTDQTLDAQVAFVEAVTSLSWASSRA